MRDENRSDDAKAELLAGTLDLVVLRTLAVGPMHGYGIAQRLQQISRDVFAGQLMLRAEQEVT
jgi:DNA-binding PadR family transcriptional regulator